MSKKILQVAPIALIHSEEKPTNQELYNVALTYVKSAVEQLNKKYPGQYELEDKVTISDFEGENQT